MAIRSPARRAASREGWARPVAERPPTRRSHPFRRLLLLLSLASFLLLGARAYVLHVYAPGLETEAQTIPVRVHTALTREGAAYTPLGAMSYHLQHAIVAIEDHRFYEHPGVDPLGILRALWLNTRNQHIDQGGSTLEEQLAKRAIVGDDRSIHQKLRTIALAWAIDQDFSKAKVLELYLNAAYFGRGAYGIGSAARIYFGTDASNLNLSQAAFLAAMPQAPSIYGSNPTAPAVRERWLQVLYNMSKDGFITPEQWAAARSSPPTFVFSTP